MKRIHMWVAIVLVGGFIALTVLVVVLSLIFWADGEEAARQNAAGS